MGAAATRAHPNGWPVGQRAVLLYGLAALAVLAATFCTAVAWSDSARPGLPAFLIAVAAFAGSYLVRLRIPLGNTMILVGWVEVGATAVLCLVPPIWAPVVVLLAGLAALGDCLVGGSVGAKAHAIFTISTIVVAMAAAAGAAAVVGAGREPVRVELDQPATLIPLVAAAGFQFLIGAGLTAAWLASVMREPVYLVFVRVVRAKRLVMAGTAVVAAATAVLVGVSAWWLVVLAPVLWTLNKVYDHQVRAAQERLTWATLAEATRSLNQLDESGVAVATLRGAARLFGPVLVEVVLRRPQGLHRTYRARSSDLLAGSGASGVSTVDSSDTSVAPEPGPPRQLEVRRLAVGDREVGEVRLHMRRGAVVSESDRHAFSTFAEAAASAFHDAATHRRLRAMTARSAYDALYDTLTGLPNRSTLLARGNEELRKAPTAAPVALILLDIGGLRQVNDTLGYAAGDELLQVVARRLMERQIEGELIGRLGGDEFAMLVMGAPAEAGAEPCDGYAVDRARFLAADLAAPAHVAGVAIAVEVRAGVVVEMVSACDMGELLRRADIALHQAKHAGKLLGRYDSGKDAFNTDRLALLADVRDALSRTDQFQLYIQPTVDLDTERPVGAEALIRWRHPRRGLVQPADFIGTIEHSDLAGAFTVHVVDMAVGVLSGWASQGVRVPISVNLCARCTLDPEFPELVARRLEKHGIRPGQLIMEITESVAMAEQGLAEQVVKGLRAVGVQVSVDDFGTGAASLSFLARFPVDEVKIDRTFVTAMVDSPETAAIVRATVELAKDLGMRVVAEGVERPEQRTALLDLGVSAAQGFLFHRPMPVDEATLVLQGRAQVATAKHIPTVRAPTP
jgi:diguanylate cyclase (GGDEF)-like protein